MPIIDLATASSEWHDYQPPAKIAGTAAAAHFEVRPAATAWGYQVQDLRNGQVYSKGIYDLTLGHSGGNPIATVLMLCNPYAHLYPHIGVPAFLPGPTNPIVRINGTINAHAEIGGITSLQPQGVLWNSNGKTHPLDMQAAHAVAFGVNGPVQIIGKNPSKVDRIHGCGFSSKGPGGEQLYPMLGIYFRNLDITNPFGSVSVFGAGSRYGRFGIYDCTLRENPNYNAQFLVRLPHGGSFDFRDVVAMAVDEHFLYHNSVNEGYVNEDSWMVDCSTPEGTGRCFAQLLHRAEESPGPGRNTVLIDRCAITGCSQAGDSADVTLAGFHGTFIMRDCYDEPVGGSLQKRSFVAWGPGNKAEPQGTEGSIYTASGGNHGTIVIINHETNKPNCVDGSHWGISGAQEVHIFNPRITGNRHGIDLDHVAHNYPTDPQYAIDGTKGFDPDFVSLGGENFSNNPFSVYPGKVRNSVNGDGTFIGPGYEHIYTDGASYADWDGINVSGSDLVRNDASNDDTAASEVIYNPLNPQDYWSPINHGGGGTSTMTASLSIGVNLSATAEGEGFSLGFLTPADPGGASMSGTARGDCLPQAALSIAIDLEATATGSANTLGSLTEGVQEDMLATAAGEAATFAEMDALADLAATVACGAVVGGMLSDGETATMVAQFAGEASTAATLSLLLSLSATAPGTCNPLGLLTPGRPPTIHATAEGSAAMSATLSELIDLSSTSDGAANVEASLTFGRSPAMVCLIDSAADVFATPNFLDDLASFFAEGECTVEAFLNLYTGDASGDVELNLNVDTFVELDLESDTSVELELLVVE